MDTMQAFARGMASRGNELMVFDWIKAAELINQYKPQRAAAGLAEDFEYTGGDIYRDSTPVPEDQTYTYLASTWATPQLILDGEVFDCYKMESEVPGWDANTYWPEEALAMLKCELAV